MHNENKFIGSRSEVRGLFMLLLGIFALLVFRYILHNESRQFSAFLKDYASSTGKDQSDSGAFSFNRYNYTMYNKARNFSRSQPIDPNTDEYGAMVKAGIPSRVAGNIVAYRNKGGEFITPEDLRIIYGVDSVNFIKIRSLVNIKSTKQFQRSLPFHSTNSVSRIDLNTADTSDLIGLPGIGTVLSKRIIRYRSALGGFYSSEQLTEVYGFSDSLYHNIDKYLLADTIKIQKLDLNSVTMKQLEKHPYLDSYEAKAIINYRRLSGPLKHPEELVENSILTDDNYNKIRHYLIAY